MGGRRRRNGGDEAGDGVVGVVKNLRNMIVRTLLISKAGRQSATLPCIHVLCQKYRRGMLPQ